MNDKENPAALTPFFSPKGIVVAGVSTNPAKLGYGLAYNLVHGGYEGAVHFVNPKGETLLGQPLHRSISEVPDPVELACLLVAAPLVPQLLMECAGRGIRHVVIASGGFRETGDEGARLEEECIAIAKREGLRIVGPNCVGLVNTHLPMNLTFLPPPGAEKGPIAFISHSGAICAAVIDWSRGKDMGLSHLVSLGNQSDICESDVLPAIAADKNTRVITMYLEGIKDGAAFVESASAAARQKPVLALKVGRSEAGRKAVASHTGALAGSESAYDAAFRRCGVIRAPGSEALFDWARVLAWCPPLQGKRIAVLTNAGGPGVTTTDTLEIEGMELAVISDDIKKELSTFLPPAAGLNNPVDMLASASPQDYARSLQLLLKDANVDGIIVLLPPPPMSSAGAVARAIIPVVQSYNKPVLVVPMGDRLVREAEEHLRAAHVPDFRYPEQAAQAMSVLWRSARFTQKTQSTLPNFDDIDHEHIASILKRELDKNGAGFINAQSAQVICQAAGIDLYPLALARSVDELGALAEETGFPLAMKIAAETIVHKTDVGGVRVNIGSREEAVDAFNTMLKTIREKEPQAVIEGVYLQKMAGAGRETIVGAYRDAQFGPLIMFGSGGTAVETQRDVAFSLAPVSEEDAEYMIKNTVAGRQLAATRGQNPADVPALKDTIFRLGRLMESHLLISEMEINPLRVFDQGAGCVALDIRLKVDTAFSH